MSEAKTLSEQQNVYEEIGRPSVYMDIQLDTVVEGEDKMEDEDIYVTKLWRAEIDKVRFYLIYSLTDTNTYRLDAYTEDPSIVHICKQVHNDMYIHVQIQTWDFCQVSSFTFISLFVLKK